MLRQKSFLLLMSGFYFFVQVFIAGFSFAQQGQSGVSMSDATDFCITCHESVTPDIVADWKNGRHSMMTPALALKKDLPQRRVSATEFPDSLMNISVGCAECHRLNAESHEDTYLHNGYRIHTVVTPEDCGVCHPHERGQYSQNLMSHAYINLTENSVYQLLIKAINGYQTIYDSKITLMEPDSITNKNSCFFCHGTSVKVARMEERKTGFGKMEFPVLTGWPNRGVGRLNPDGSMGACTPCHARHQFSIEMARKPYTCSECHKGPDVPAYKVYMVSKHGNIFYSLNEDWNFTNVPWVIGEDFTAPTCAVCHVSLLHNAEGDVVVNRTHQMNDRIYVRIFGLIYSHPHPQGPNTSVIVNGNGLQLPTQLDGTVETASLITEQEQAIRKKKMMQVCLQCHSRYWVEEHFEAFERANETTDQMVLTATNIMRMAWEENLAEGLEDNKNIFDEAIEKMWVEQWLFFSNSIRLSAAMAGADYGVFANGRWYNAKNVQIIKDYYELLKQKSQK